MLRFAPRSEPRDLPVLFFDGQCVMCNRQVQRLVQLDRNAIFRFAALDGQTAERIPTGSRAGGIDSVVLLDEDGVHVRSEAVLRTISRLGGLWRIASWVLRLAPRGMRDAGYDWVAGNRTRWFGRVESCGLLSPEERHRLLP